MLISPLKLEILLAEDEKESPEVLMDMDSAKAANFTHKQLLFLRDFLERYMKKKSKKRVSADRETDPPFLFT